MGPDPTLPGDLPAALAGYLAWLGAWSVIAFATYGFDKWRAVRGGRRIPERRLHRLALVGGAAGGWLGMLLFRHKRRTAAVRRVLALATILQLALAAWLAGTVRGPG
jgi:uncharacterized membrane protein YsdA (DUF1294 family)